ncbi:MAG: class I tRNA ligase family protein [Magnetococcales bacterium]|nr:class I tRNA ligase family protein [Magnetococcales bacterium]
MYKTVSKSLDFVTIEKQFLRFWQENNIFSQLREKNAHGEVWSFQDGPITANNPMGVHHAWGRSLKDIFQRYHAMSGRQLRYQNGFDCQGLWVEVEIEKEHAFKSKKDILAFGMDRFVRACKERVLTFAAKQTEQSIRLGYWMDWDDPGQLRRLQQALHDDLPEITYTAPSGNRFTGTPEQIIANLGSPEYGGSYFTFSNENNYTIWSFLKKCHADGHIYRGTDVMTWCPRCGTGLSQMEVAEGRKITEHTSVYVRFPILGREREAFLVWTTTPWTLTSMLMYQPSMRRNTNSVLQRQQCG